MSGTYMAKSDEVERAWYVVDAEGETLGRMSTEIARVLLGKHKPRYTPHVDTGDFVIVVNADKVSLSGAKDASKLYRRHTTQPGSMKSESAEELRRRHPERLVERAVKGMLPKSRLGRRQLRKLKVYAGDEHPHEAQRPQPLDMSRV